MQWTDQIRNVKISLVITAVLIAGASLFVSHSLIKDLQAEEHRKMGIWAEAMRTIIRADENTDLSLTLKVLDSNHTIPVIVLDNNGNVLETRNLKVRNSTESDTRHRTPPRWSSLSLLFSYTSSSVPSTRVCSSRWPSS